MSPSVNFEDERCLGTSAQSMLVICPTVAFVNVTKTMISLIYPIMS